eukprot:scaffold68740_cov63-Attheya_sp.AAC.1
MNPLIHEPCSAISTSQTLFEQYRVALNRDTWDIFHTSEDPIRRATIFHNFLIRMFSELTSYYLDDKDIVMAVILEEQERSQQEEDEEEVEQKRKETLKRRKNARQQSSKDTSNDPARKTGFTTKKQRVLQRLKAENKAEKPGVAMRKKKTSKDAPHVIDVSDDDDDSLGQRPSRKRSRVQTLNEEVKGWGYTGPKTHIPNVKSKAQAHTQTIKHNMARAAIEWDDFVLQEDWNSLMYVNCELRGDPKEDTLIKELSFTSCKRLQTNKKSKFFVGVTAKGRKFIVHEEYFDSNKIFSFPFLANVKKNSNVDHKLTSAMKQKLKKQRLLYSVHYQIVRIAKVTDKNKATVYRGWSLKEVSVILDLYWIEENFKIREPEFYNALTSSKEDEVILPVPIGKCRGRLRPSSIIIDTSITKTYDPEAKHVLNSDVVPKMDLCIDDDFKQSWFAPRLADLNTNEETEITDCPTFKSCKAPKSAKSASFKLSVPS